MHCCTLDRLLALSEAVACLYPTCWVDSVLVLCQHVLMSSDGERLEVHELQKRLDADIRQQSTTRSCRGPALDCCRAAYCQQCRPMRERRLPQSVPIGLQRMPLKTSCSEGWGIRRDTPTLDHSETQACTGKHKDNSTTTNLTCTSLCVADIQVLHHSGSTRCGIDQIARSNARKGLRYERRSRDSSFRNPADFS